MNDKNADGAPPAIPSSDWDMTPDEFEELTTRLIEEVMGAADAFTIERHTILEADDGTYDIDAAVTFEVGGFTFLVLVEAKRHKDPIKRELVAVLHQKLRSTGAHKGLLASASGFQSGAITFAKRHGIALATVSDGQLKIENKADPNRTETTDTAASVNSIPILVAQLIPSTPEAEPVEVELTGGELLGYLIRMAFPDLELQ
jgi:restriction endonuclease